MLIFEKKKKVKKISPSSEMKMSPIHFLSVMRCGTLWIWGSLSQECNTAGGFSGESKNSSAELAPGPILLFPTKPASRNVSTGCPGP